jgi:hypothetical protein
MNYELELLETLLTWLKKQPIINQQETLLLDETKRLEKVMLHHLMTLSNKTQLNTYLQINLHKLVEICDQLYNPDSKDNPHAAVVLELLISVRKAAKTLAPQDLELPLLLRKIKSDQFETQWLGIKDQLNRYEIDNTLIEIIAFACHNFAHSRFRPKWSNDLYLQFFYEALDELPEKTNVDLLIHLLIRLGFNHSRFTAYCYRWIRSRFDGKSLEEKTKLLWGLKKELKQLEVLNSNSFDPRKQSIMDELLKWVEEEQISLAYDENQILPNPMKFNTKFKVLELAYWQKLQYDHGVYEEVNLDMLSEKIAHNFSSKNQEELSAPSIKSKFYPKDRQILATIEKLLKEMLDDVGGFLH